MDAFGFHDGNISKLLETRRLDDGHDINHNLQMHSSFIMRLTQEKELEGHQGCVNSISWNPSGSLLISGSDDTRLNIWKYTGLKLLHSVGTGHSANIFSTKFIPETSDELVASGAGDAEVRLFNLSILRRMSGPFDSAVAPLALYQCHTRRVKKVAVETGNPNVVWSASEDGTMRQHDVREGASCPLSGSSPQECRSILLDLRTGAKKSLADSPKQTLALKSCDISTTQPHLLLVAGSDAFARLYDRRMLPTLSSSQKIMSPPPCVNYFCPLHLSEHGRASLHITHVTFSPGGDEILISYSGEHVYLMNVNCAGGTSMHYIVGDASKLMSFTPILNGLDLQPPSSHFVGSKPSESNVGSMAEKFQQYLRIAEKSLVDGKNYFLGIEACNEILDGYQHDIRFNLKHECLCIRAALFLKRMWKNDVHMAIRDCYSARRIDPSSFKALYYMSEALSQLRKFKDALGFAIAAQCVAPSNIEVSEWVENIKNNISTAEAEKSNRATIAEQKAELQRGRELLLSDILSRSDADTEASVDGPSSMREDFYDDEELELDIETEIPFDEIHHVDFDIGILRRNFSSSETSCKISTDGSLSSKNGLISCQPEVVIDMKRRFVGHCNVGTDIKEASFLGQKGEFVASGSDDGRWFIWEKRTGRLIKMLLADEAVVNCVQCHPFDCAVATSGIDDTIKIWTPSSPMPSIVAGGAAGPGTSNVLEIMARNQRRLCNNRHAVMPREILEQLHLHQSAEIASQPFECVQI